MRFQLFKTKTKKGNKSIVRKVIQNIISKKIKSLLSILKNLW